VAYLAAAVAALALAGRVRTQDRFADVKIRAEAAGPGIAMLAGAGGNIGVCTGSDGVLVAFQDMLVTVRDRVRALIKTRKTLEQTIAAKPTADLDPTWGSGFIKPDQMVETVYTDLSHRM